MKFRDRYQGLLLGAAVGDALGLPREGVSRGRAGRLFPRPLSHGFFFGYGMISDDTEHTIFVCQSLLADDGSAENFARRLAWSLRWWFVALPAGIGLATARAILRLWLGIKPAGSGVSSAGNGPAMRAAPIGAYFSQDPERLNAFVDQSTRITHTDERALVGAKTVAVLTAWIVAEDLQQPPAVDEVMRILRDLGKDQEWSEILDAFEHAAEKALSVGEFADRLGLSSGVTGYIYHTVPVAVYAWYHHFGDFKATVEAVIQCGGDADTVGLIAGSLAGVTVGGKGIPVDWVSKIADWPRNVTVLKKLAAGLADKQEGKNCEPVRYCWPGVLPRNVIFLIVVLLHGFRRILPPY